MAIPRIKPKVAGAGGVFKLMPMSKPAIRLEEAKRARRQANIDQQRKAGEQRRIGRGLEIERQRKAAPGIEREIHRLALQGRKK